MTEQRKEGNPHGVYVPLISTLRKSRLGGETLEDELEGTLWVIPYPKSKPSCKHMAYWPTMMSDQIQSDPFHVSASSIGLRFFFHVLNSPNKMTRLFGHPGIDRYLQSTSTMSLESVRIVTF
jgi:hypothetical protein